MSETVDTYVRSLSAGACEQLTAEARLELAGRCRSSLRLAAAGVGPERLEAAAVRGLEIDVDGTTASAVVRVLDARLTLVRRGDTWRIARGTSLDVR